MKYISISSFNAKPQIAVKAFVAAIMPHLTTSNSIGTIPSPTANFNQSKPSIPQNFNHASPLQSHSFFLSFPFHRHSSYLSLMVVFHAESKACKKCIRNAIQSFLQPENRNVIAAVTSARQLNFFSADELNILY